MENSEENKIKLEYEWDDGLSKHGSEKGSEKNTSSDSIHQSVKFNNVGEDDNKLSIESFKLSFLQEFASTNRPSGIMFSSSIKMSKDSIIFENDEVSLSREVDYFWIFDRLSDFGVIESLYEYEEYVSRSNIEYNMVTLTVNSMKDINSKLEGYLKESLVSGNSNLAPSTSLRLRGSKVEFARTEVIRILELVTINSVIEQPEKMLMLTFLIIYSLETLDFSTFTEVAKFLFHLSELRRFNDAFLRTLDDLYYFGSNNNKIQVTEIVDLESPLYEGKNIQNFDWLFALLRKFLTLL
jgi:hypothetical protein